MRNYLKKIAAQFPRCWQQELKRTYFGAQITLKRFRTDEKEYAILKDFVSAGDWVIDVGANIGHYSAKLSQIVGKNGRVIAFEPVPDTFDLLATNAMRFEHRNITLLNVAASHRAGVVSVRVPKFDSGLHNYYQAHLTREDGDFEVFCITVDSLLLPHRISLAKVDAEGHELSVLIGMREVIQRDHPILIVEDNVPEVIPFLREFGYLSEKLEDSSNRIFRF
jgi:FkbM family methyltransferase